MFDPAESKYGVKREEKVKKTVEKRAEEAGAPAYLRNDQMYKDFTQKDFELKNP